MPDLVYTVVVPTMNRPEELRRCLADALVQSPPPAEILIVDDGNLDEAELRRGLGPNLPPLRVVRKEKPGLVGSLILAGELVRTPWMLVLDDDIYLERPFMAQIVRALNADPAPNRIAAVAGFPLLAGRKRTWRAAVRLGLERVFLLNGFAEGRFLPSSYFTDYECGRTPNAPWDVEHVPGGLALWRTEVFRGCGYDPWYEGYAYGCDMELAYRATRSWRAICVPTARALHDKSPRSRVPTERLGRLKIRNQHYFFVKHFRGSLWKRACYYWATFGHLLILSLAALTAPGAVAVRLAEVRGMLAEVLKPTPLDRRAA